jgi:hypothetical protein
VEWPLKSLLGDQPDFVFLWYIALHGTIWCTVQGDHIRASFACTCSQCQNQYAERTVAGVTKQVSMSR